MMFVIKVLFLIGNPVCSYFLLKCCFLQKSCLVSRQEPKEVTCACRVELQDRERESVNAAALGPLACPSCSAWPRKCLNLT